MKKGEYERNIERRGGSASWFVGNIRPQAGQIYNLDLWGVRRDRLGVHSMSHAAEAGAWLHRTHFLLRVYQRHPALPDPALQPGPFSARNGALFNQQEAKRKLAVITRTRLRGRRRPFSSA